MEKMENRLQTGSKICRPHSQKLYGVRIVGTIMIVKYSTVHNENGSRKLDEEHDGMKKRSSMTNFKRSKEPREKWPDGRYRIKWKNVETGEIQEGEQWVYGAPSMCGWEIIEKEFLYPDEPLDWGKVSNDQVGDLINAILVNAVNEAIYHAGEESRAQAWRFLERKEYESWTNVDLQKAVYFKLESMMKEVKEYLKQYRKKRAAVRRLRAVIEESNMIDAEMISILRESLILPAAHQDGMPKGSGAKDRLAEVEAQIDEIQRRMNERQLELCEELEKTQGQLQNMFAQINKIPNETMKMILMLRYVKDLKWDDIADKLNFNPDHLRKRMHLRALDEFYVCNKKLFPDLRAKEKKPIK